jgi:AcrR family transcriptional regulator
MPEPGSTADTSADEVSEGAAGGGDDLRERLLEAAATVFAREGYAGTRVVDIVREAGVSTGAVYGRFDSKNDLLREAVVQSSVKGGVLASEAPDFGALLRHAARQVARPLRTTEALRLEAYVAARREPEVSNALDDAYRHWREAVEPLVAAAKADGVIPEDADTEAVLFLYRTLYLGLLLHRGSGQDGPDPEAWVALVERVVDAIGTGAGAGAGAGPAAGAGKERQDQEVTE